MLILPREFTILLVSMVKYLKVTNDGLQKLSRVAIHKLVQDLKSNLHLDISSLLINFIKNKDIVEINSKYLDHKSSTDIITFDYSGDNLSIDGELFISYEEAELNAKRYSVKTEEEITRLIIHGVLHLIGYDDKAKSDKLVMKRLENKLLKKYKYHLIR